MVMPRAAALNALSRVQHQQQPLEPRPCAVLGDACGGVRPCTGACSPSCGRSGRNTLWLRLYTLATVQRSPAYTEIALKLSCVRVLTRVCVVLLFTLIYYHFEIIPYGVLKLKPVKP